MKKNYRLKSHEVSAIKFDGTNYTSVCEFLNTHGLTETQIAKTKDPDEMKVKVGTDWLNIPKGDYVTIEDEQAINVITGVDFEEYYEAMN